MVTLAIMRMLGKSTWRRSLCVTLLLARGRTRAHTHTDTHSHTGNREKDFAFGREVRQWNAVQPQHRGKSPSTSGADRCVGDSVGNGFKPHGGERDLIETSTTATATPVQVPCYRWLS